LKQIQRKKASFRIPRKRDFDRLPLREDADPTDEAGLRRFRRPATIDGFVDVATCKYKRLKSASAIARRTCDCGVVPCAIRHIDDRRARASVKKTRHAFCLARIARRNAGLSLSQI
jgi:hypothetical protein